MAVTRSAVAETPMLHAHFTGPCVMDAELVVMNFYTAQKWICPDTQASIARVPVVDLYRSRDLDLDRLTFI